MGPNRSTQFATTCLIAMTSAPHALLAAVAHPVVFSARDNAGVRGRPPVAVTLRDPGEPVCDVAGAERVRASPRLPLPHVELRRTVGAVRRRSLLTGQHFREPVRPLPAQRMALPALTAVRRGPVPASAGNAATGMSRISGKSEAICPERSRHTGPGTHLQKPADTARPPPPSESCRNICFLHDLSGCQASTRTRHRAPPAGQTPHAARSG